jgi:hypothetical protein
MRAKIQIYEGKDIDIWGQRYRYEGQDIDIWGQRYRYEGKDIDIWGQRLLNYRYMLAKI